MNEWMGECSLPYLLALNRGSLSAPVTGFRCCTFWLAGFGNGDG